MMKKLYIKKRDGTYYTKYTKEEISNLINPLNFETIKPFLKELDYAPCEECYNHILQHSEIEPRYAWIRLVAQMRLAAYRAFGYEDWVNTHLT